MVLTCLNLPTTGKSHISSPLFFSLIRLVCVVLCFYYSFSFITQPSVFLSFLLLLLLWRCFVQLYNEFVPGGLLTCFHRFFDWEKIAIITVNVNDKWHTHALSQQNENIWCSSCSLCCSTNPSSKLYMRRVLYIDAKVEPRIKHAHSVSIVEVSFIYHNNNLSNGMKKKKKTTQRYTRLAIRFKASLCHTQTACKLVRQTCLSWWICLITCDHLREQIRLIYKWLSLWFNVYAPKYEEVPLEINNSHALKLIT